LGVADGIVVDDVRLALPCFGDAFGEVAAGGDEEGARAARGVRS
jgi:hypothetical protein